MKLKKIFNQIANMLQKRLHSIKRISSTLADVAIVNVIMPSCSKRNVPILHGKKIVAGDMDGGGDIEEHRR